MTEAIVIPGDTTKAYSHSSDSSLRYMPGLDVMRGIAICAVLTYHGIGSFPTFFEAFHASWANLLLEIFVRGGKGVQLFFVLSGFLISGLLLDRRNNSNYYSDFYLRRVLRIAPAYLVMLAVLYFTKSISTRFLTLSLLYVANMPGLLHVHPEYGPLWSLSVEEQFYLVWPWIVRHTSRRQLARFCVGLIVLTPVLRFALLHGPSFLSDIYFKTWAVGDFFAAGTLLALAVRSQKVRNQDTRSLERLILPLFLGFAALESIQIFYHPPTASFMHNVRASIMLESWLCLSTVLVLIGWLKPSLASINLVRPLLFLAKISYGLYLCHQFLFNLVERYWVIPNDGRISSLGIFFLRFLCETLLAIAVATLSRYTLEEFFLRLKPKARPTGPSVPQLT